MRVSGGDGDLKMELTDQEAGILRSLLDEMATLLDADVPEDAIKARLFPPASEDPQQQATFAELTRSDLENEKRAAVRDVREQLGPRGPVVVDLDDDDVGTWLRLLTDLRLAIGTRLEVTDETMAAEIDPNDPNAAALSVLHWLGWMTESILERTTA
ncbi:MAG TPA: DUF2017 family protein [Actinomycetota bacterium]|nr:DUF2017 family protein [Actinomycetota bacterium]